MRSGQHSTPCCAFDEPGNVLLLLTFHNSFSLYPFWFLFWVFFSFPRPKSQTVDVMMMTTMHQTFANDDTFLFVSAAKETKQKSEIKYNKTKQNEKKKKKKSSFSSCIFFFLSCSPAVSLDPSMRSSYDSSAGPVDSLCVSSVRHSMGSHEKRRKKKGKILFI